MKPHEVKHNVEDIQTRNQRVEADKAWEISWTRRSIIAVGTYVVIGTYLSFLKIEAAWLHAFVPSGAYIISTFSLFMFKKLWLETIYIRDSSE